MRTERKSFPNILKDLSIYLIFSGLLLFGTLTLVMANPPVPAGTGGGGGAPTAAPATGAPVGDPAAAAQQPGIFGMLFPFILMFGVIYFFMIRPQQKRMKEQQKMLGELQHGDEVVTASGILGTIRGITEKVVTLEVADKVRIRLLKSQVSQVVKGQIKDLA